MPVNFRLRGWWNWAFHTRLDYGFRPAWTSGLERGTAHAGLKNLGNSCWLNAALQCFRWTRPLYNAFTARLMECDESILGSLHLGPAIPESGRFGPTWKETTGAAYFK